MMNRPFREGHRAPQVPRLLQPDSDGRGGATPTRLFQRVPTVRPAPPHLTPDDRFAGPAVERRVGVSPMSHPWLKAAMAGMLTIRFDRCAKCVPRYRSAGVALTSASTMLKRGRSV